MDNTAGARPGQRGRLDASGEREVVFCHQCDNEWWQDEHGLVCPRCEGEIIEIVDLNADPRPEPPRRPDTPPEIQGIRDHNPWVNDDGQDSDPDEMDIEEHVTHNPDGSLRFTRTVRNTATGTRVTTDRGSRPWQEFGDANNSDHVMRNFQDMIGDLVGPQLRHGQAGRSGADTLFNVPAQQPTAATGYQIGSAGGPTFMGGRVTYTSGNATRTETFGGRARHPGARHPGPEVDLPAYEPPPSTSPDDPQDLPPPTSPDDHPPDDRPVHTIRLRIRPDQVPRILGSLFGGGPDPTPAEGAGLPPALQGLFRAMLNPVNARSGDAVYSQEALDQIISNLMDQHQTSNAPGPASAEAIAALPKKKLGEKELGAEGKGECSVCMDDVSLGDEVVSLPCGHWFHEVCAGMWLGEHNTCPICRKGIEGDATSSSSPGASRSAAGPNSGPDANREMHGGGDRDPSARLRGLAERSQARLDAIRNTAGQRERYGDYSSSPRVPRESRPWMSDSRDSRPRTGSSGDGEYSGMPGAFERRSSGMSSLSASGRNRGEGEEGRRTGSRRSSQSGSGGSASGNSGGGVAGWIRNQFGGGQGGGGSGGR